MVSHTGSNNFCQKEDSNISKGNELRDGLQNSNNVATTIGKNWSSKISKLNKYFRKERSEVLKRTHLLIHIVVMQNPTPHCKAIL